MVKLAPVSAPEEVENGVVRIQYEASVGTTQPPGTFQELHWAVHDQCEGHECPHGSKRIDLFSQEDSCKQDMLQCGASEVEVDASDATDLSIPVVPLSPQRELQTAQNGVAWFSGACFESQNGLFAAKWEDAPGGGDSLLFTVQAATDNWLAIGFGSSQGMRNLDTIVSWVGAGATAGTYAATSVDAHASSNNGPGGDPSQEGVLVVSGDRFVSAVDGSTSITRVQFLRARKPNGIASNTTSTTTTASSSNYDLSSGASPQFLMWAFGPPGRSNPTYDAAASSIQGDSQHPSSGRGFSSQKVDFGALQCTGIVDVGVPPYRGPAFQAHAAILVLAYWALMVPAAFMARYRFAAKSPSFCCGCCSSSPKLFGYDLWFTFHMFLQIASVFLAFIGLLILIIHLKELELEAEYPPHQLVGFISIVLAILQLIMGMMRPDKHHPYRALFLWAHRITSFTTILLGTVAIGLGCAKAELKPGVTAGMLTVHLVILIGAVILGEYIWFTHAPSGTVASSADLSLSRTPATQSTDEI